MFFRDLSFDVDLVAWGDLRSDDGLISCSVEQAMKTLMVLSVAVLALIMVRRVFAEAPLSAEEAQARIQSGQAILVDVREISEWQAGVAEPAVLLPLSDLKGTRSKWSSFLNENKNKEFLLYCRSGNRSGIAAEILRREGFRVTNAGSYNAWKNEGLPTREP